MKNLFFIIFSIIYILLFPLKGNTNNHYQFEEKIDFYEEEIKQERVVILSSYSLENHKNNCLMDDSLNNKKFLIKEFYLNFHSTTPHKQKVLKAKTVWEKVLEFYPNKIIIYGNEIVDLLSDEIKEISKTKQVALLNLTKTNNNYETNINLTRGLIIYREININTIFDFLKDNGININNFYIIRNPSRYSLEIEEEIKKQIFDNSPYNKINTLIVHSLYDINLAITNLQFKPIGLVFVLVDEIYDYKNNKFVNFEKIKQEINSRNLRQLTINVLFNDCKKNKNHLLFTISKPFFCKTSSPNLFLTKFLNNEFEKRVVVVKNKNVLSLSLKQIIDLNYKLLLTNLTKVYCIFDN